MKASKGSCSDTYAYTFVLVAAVMLVASLVQAHDLSLDRFSAAPSNNRAHALDVAFSGLVIISEIDLGAMRGGFRVGGLDIGISANVRTLFDGQLAFESGINLTGNRLATQSLPSSTVGRPGLAVITGNESGATLRNVTAGRIGLSGLKGSQGAVLNDDLGVTVALNQITKDGFLSVLFNQASGRSVRHEVNIDVTIKNFSKFQQAVRSATLANRFSTTR